MNTAFQWIGAIISLAFGMAALVGSLMWSYGTLRDRMERNAKRQCTIEISNFLRNSANWFGEDPPTAALLRDCADQYAAGVMWISESDVRDKWREARGELGRTK